MITSCTFLFWIPTTISASWRFHIDFIKSFIVILFLYRYILWCNLFFSPFQSYNTWSTSICWLSILPLVLVYFKHFLCYVFIYGVFYRCLISLGYLPFLQVLNIRFFVFWKALVVVHNMDNMLYALCCFLEFRWIIDNISVQFEPLWLLWVFLFSLSPEIAFKGK